MAQFTEREVFLMIVEQYIPQTPFIALLVSALLGSIIGIERDIRGRAAGLRTNLVVALGSTLFTLISSYTVIAFEGSSDPTRIAAQIVSGIGFLGAGVIIKSGLSIKGLTSAASLWLVSAIGMAAGFHYYTLALATTVLGVISLSLLDYLERTYKKDYYRQVSITGNTDIDAHAIGEFLMAQGCRIQSTNCIIKGDSEIRLIYQVKVHVKKEYQDKGFEMTKELLKSSPNIWEIRWEKR